jgi:hypothetical protein
MRRRSILEGEIGRKRPTTGSLFSSKHGPSYLSEVVSDVELSGLGCSCSRHGESQQLDWGRVERCAAAEVGEPEGVRTIVFDLVVEIADGHCVVYRFDADPGEDSMAVARTIEAALGSGRCDSAVLALAKDGISSRWYPEIESFEAANHSAILGDGPGGSPLSA